MRKACLKSRFVLVFVACFGWFTPVGCFPLDDDTTIVALPPNNCDNGVWEGSFQMGYDESYNNPRKIEGCPVINQNLSFSGDYTREDIEVFDALESVRGDVIFYLFNYQGSVDGLFPSLVSIGGQVNIGDVSGMSDLSIFESLKSIAGGISLRSTSITDLSGLSNLESFQGGITILRLSSLIDLTGLEPIESVTDGIHLDSNDALQSLSGLENVQRLAGGLKIVGNPVLTDLSGLDHLTSFDGPLEITYNAMLADCEIERLIKVLTATGWQGSIVASGNDPDGVCP